MRVARRTVNDFSKSNKEHHEINAFIDDVVRSLNSVRFGDGAAGGAENIECDFATIEFSTAGTEATAAHTLRRVPTGVIVIKADRPGDVYASSTWTSANIYLKADSDSMSAIVMMI
jgi:hypothetical protein